MCSVSVQNIIGKCTIKCLREKSLARSPPPCVLLPPTLKTTDYRADRPRTAHAKARSCRRFWKPGGAPQQSHGRRLIPPKASLPRLALPLKGFLPHLTRGEPKGCERGRELCRRPAGHRHRVLTVAEAETVRAPEGRALLHSPVPPPAASVCVLAGT